MSYVRNIATKIEAALADTPVVLINGARQTGKSTLANWILANTHSATAFTLDNVATLSAIQSDPQAFIAGLQGASVIDEVQRAPNLFISIKEAVDKDRQPGRFLLTGSANVLLLPQLSDSLAGRMEIINLWPLSQGELQGIKEQFIDQLFKPDWQLPPHSVLSRQTLMEKIVQGGYPEILARSDFDRKVAWFDNYLTAILQRDVRDLANIEGLTLLPRLLKLLATRTSSLLNMAELSRTSTIPHTTLTRYLTLLQTIFLIYTLPAWSGNLGKRVSKAPKFYFGDTGLASYLIGIELERLMLDPQLAGPLLENFVVTELKKQQGWSKKNVQLFHYRTQTGQEVDIVIEDRSGNCVGIEVKCSTSVSSQDFKGLRYLAEHLGETFVRGIVLYTGEQVLPFGKNLYAVPVNMLWHAF